MIKLRLQILLSGAAVIAMLSAVNVRLAATECIKDCGCVNTQHYGAAYDLACVHPEQCKFRECVYSKAKCDGWPYASYVNECNDIPDCDAQSACQGA